MSRPVTPDDLRRLAKHTEKCDRLLLNAVNNHRLWIIALVISNVLLWVIR